MKTISKLSLIFALITSTAPVAYAAGRVLKLEELSFTDIDKLDRTRSIFFLTFGNLEEHGPHLPVGSDYFQAIGVRDGLIARLRAVHPDYDFVLVPVVPLGEGGANNMALQLDHIGTFDIRYETLLNVAIDLGATIARKGFQNIFLIHSHGSPLHNVAFTEAAAFVSERYKIRMVNITSLIFGEGFYSPKVMEKYLGEGWEKKIGFEGHAGAGETSATLFLRGELVKPEYRQLQPFIAKDLAEFFRTYERTTGWQGYWGDPAKASKAMGKDLINDFVERSFRIAEKALAGEDLSKLPVYPNSLPPLSEVEIFGKRIGENYAKQTAEIEAWLKNRQSVQSVKQ
ncbi:creatininase family protein [bacterium]|nr:creatininase family protein [bacterium]MCI0697353.1 creatininase family protein [candidate division KSB1 bacterium]